MFRRLNVRKLLLAVFMGTASQAFASVPGPWVALGPDGGDARRIVPDPGDHAHLYLGTVNGWLYESHNAGRSWKRLAQVGRRDDLVLDSILIDPQDPKHLVVGAWLIDRPEGGGGIYYSVDGGLTWSNQAEMRGQSVLSMTQSVLRLARYGRRYAPGRCSARWTAVCIGSGSLQRVTRRFTTYSPSPSIRKILRSFMPEPGICRGRLRMQGEHWGNIKQGIIEDSRRVFDHCRSSEPAHGLRKCLLGYLQE